MTADVWAAVPGVIWAAIVVGVLFAFRNEIRKIIPRIRAVKVAGFEAQFNEAVRAAASKRKLTVDAAEQTAIERRAERDAAALEGARILWVDDDPDGNSNEREALRAAGVEVENAVSTEEAFRLLRRKDRDLIVSDIDRETNPKEGLEFLDALRGEENPIPVIFYITNIDATLPIPRGAVAITDHPVTLLHTIFDVLERSRG
jgi:CheY-like chemotaxis protein